MKSTQIFILVAILGLSMQFTAHSENIVHKIHVPISEAELKMEKFIPRHYGAKHDLGAYHPIKIHADTQELVKQYYAIDANNDSINLRGKIYFMVKTLIPAVVKHMSDTFRVRESPKTRITQATCQQATVPANLKQYQNADLILLFTAQAEKTDGFVAWASPCQLHA